MDDPFSHATLGSGVFYKNPLAALGWLSQAFGFERSMLVTDADGKLVHAEMRFGDGYIVVDSEWASYIASPASVGGKNTQSLYVRLTSGIEGHFERAKSAGAVILQPLADQFYGERTYKAVDPEGHVWTFSQTVGHVSQDEAEKLSGMKIDGWHYPSQ
ncbi:glyoxalase [Mesorhizobium sp. BAC0120]|uniref:VOC family protein n=1 Tax=Mesorhizobium sp. BAC0120 TaxID=3090670 RepID=UPI00298C0A37|nr:VOC family protein [Mesorhizobium sp. BAC0120]MDW6020883.1 glyoxalase [Mesorhizobium sp. BAC0120]